jgi:hypothetical protein
MAANYYLFLLQSDAVHTGIDIVYCVVVGLQIAYVFKTGRRKHLSWLIPLAVSACGTLGYRIVIDFHQLLQTRWSSLQLEALSASVEVKDGFGIWGAIALWRMMKRGEIFSKSSPAAHAADPDAWPPAPVRPIDESP